MLKDFNLQFYKNLNNVNYRSPSEIKNEILVAERSISQYLSCNEFDNDYKFMGMEVSIQGDPQAHKIQRISLYFENKDI